MMGGGMKGGRRATLPRLGGAAAALGAVMGVMLALLSPERAAADETTLCAVPDALDFSEAELVNVAARLKAGEEVRIVVVGTASSAGTGLVAPLRPYPDRIAGELAKQFPKGRFAIANLSSRGMLATAMLARIEQDVLPGNPALVIWQTGTVETVHGTDIDAFGDTLESGLSTLRGHGSDVILMDMQYSSQTSTLVDPSPYRDVMRWIARAQSVMLFDRFAFMRYWEETGLIDFTSPLKTDQARSDNLVHGCIAELLAEMIAKGVARAEESMRN